MKRWLIEIIICPSCLPEENRLTERILEEHQDDIINGELFCEQCNKIYPVNDGTAFLQTEHPGEKNPSNR